MTNQCRKPKRVRHYSVRKLLEKALSAMPNVLSWRIVKRDGVPRVVVEIKNEEQKA